MVFLAGFSCVANEGIFLLADVAANLGRNDWAAVLFGSGVRLLESLEGIHRDDRSLGGSNSAREKR